MMPDISEERRKWDELYGSLPLADEDEPLQRFNLEFAQKVLDLLPEGGNVLEMGCGAGWQSLALARTGKFQVTLLDFSQKALNHARAVFERENMPATFIQADAYQPGEGEFDLVFNAGVIEHYDVEQQTAMLRSMAKRSRKYVMVIAPNRLCEWYWLWRIQATAQANWPFGKEAPVVDLSNVIQAAGMDFVGQAFMGENWTELFIKGITGMDDGLRELALDVHRSLLLSPPQKSYLIAALGSVVPVQAPPAGWEPPILLDQSGTGDLIESIALALNQVVQEKATNRQLKSEKDQEISRLQAEIAQLQINLDAEREQFESELQVEKERAKNELQAERERLESELQADRQRGEDELQAERQRLEDELQAERQRLENELKAVRYQLEGDLLARQKELDQLQLDQREKEQSISLLSARLDEIYGSHAWKLVQAIWGFQVAIRRYRFLAWLERKVRSGVRRMLR